jgi:hypothetical protein
MSKDAGRVGAKSASPTGNENMQLAKRSLHVLNVLNIRTAKAHYNNVTASITRAA